MRSDELRRVVEQLYEAIDRNDVDALIDVLCTDIVYYRPAIPPLRGQAAMRHFYLHERKIPKGLHSLEHIAIDGGCGAAWGSFEGVREDGSPVAVRFADCFTFADGRILTRRSHLC